MRLRCGTCGDDKDEECFSRKSNSKRGRSYKCKDCHNAYVRKTWYPENKQKQVNSSVEWKRRNKIKVLATKYGMSFEDVEKAFDKAGGKCQICGGDSKLCLDHCHDTGKLRGFLCRECNIGLGHFKDRPELLVSAAEYLKI